MATSKKEDPLLGKRVRIDADVTTNADGAICLWGGTEATVAGAERRSNGKVYLLKPDDAERAQPFPMSSFTVMPLAGADAAGAAATAAAPAGEMVHASPHLVAYSLDNPRKRRGLDLDSLTALASSIKAQGLAQPILVRPLPGSRQADTFRDRGDGLPLPTYELVCGERRLRASLLAGLDTMPMLVRPLNDEQALELQLVENIEREDLDPMEEAEGFELLRTRCGYSAEQIADRIGRGRGKDYVYKTMKLLALTPESREALHEGHLGRSTGLLVARYSPEQQPAVVKFIKDLARDGEPAPFRTVAPQVFMRFNLGLAKTIWLLDDADLVPAAGACSACHKRTGAHGDLFDDDAGSPDSCTDPDCFDGKRQAHVARVKAEAEAQGLQVIDGDAAKAAVHSPFSHWIQGYSKLSDVAYTETGDDGNERSVTFEDALRAKGRKAPKPQVLIHPFSGEAIKVIPEELADKLMPEDDGKGAQHAATSSRRPAFEDTRTPEEKALDDYHVRRAVLLRIFDVVRNRDRTDADMLLIAKALFALQLGDDNLPSLEDYLSWSDLEDESNDGALAAVFAKLDAMPPAEVAFVVTIAAVEIAFTRYGFSRAASLQIAQGYGVDVLAVQDKVAEDLDRPGADDDSEGDGGEDEGAAAELPPGPTEAISEIEPYVGARVRIKDGLRGPNGKLRKICGREGVLQAHTDGGTWTVKCDGSKEKTIVQRDEFTVLAAQEEEDAGDETAESATAAVDQASTPAVNAALAAWPFPPRKATA